MEKVKKKGVIPPFQAVNLPLHTPGKKERKEHTKEGVEKEHTTEVW